MKKRETGEGEYSVFGKPKKRRGGWGQVFVAMPFREEIDPVYIDHIKPLVEKLKLTCKRGDDFFTTNAVIDDIWSAINFAELCIVDCTGRNPNVFYELGIAHTLGRRAILIAQSLEDIPFDIRHLRHITYQYTPRGMRQFEEKLLKTIKAELSLDDPDDLLQSQEVLQEPDAEKYDLAQSKNADQLEDKAKMAWYSGEYEAAIKFAEAAIELKPRATRSYEVLGEALIKLNKFREAIEVGQKLTQLDPLSYDGYEIIGEAYYELVDYQQARFYLEKALELVTPNFRQFALMRLISTYEAMGLMKETKDTLEELMPIINTDLKPRYEQKLERFRILTSRISTTNPPANS